MSDGGFRRPAHRRPRIVRLAWTIALLVIASPASSQNNAILSAVDSAPLQVPLLASCASSTCHGGIDGRGPAWTHAFSVWHARDPHAGAGRLLRDIDSRAIVQRLDPRAASDQLTYDRVLQSRCISCHTSSGPKDCEVNEPLDASLLEHGVECQSCHGSAERWLQPHLAKDWSGPERFEETFGMRDTESIIGRASTCVRCHVGSRTDDGVVRDMNHDLIAAGHPALRFDLLVYSENLPKHWDVSSDAESAFQQSAVQVRQISRAVTLSTAASLAAQRATDHLRDREMVPRPALSVPWPELSDYDCFACHQTLSIRDYRLAAVPDHTADVDEATIHRARPGIPVWNAWHTIGNEWELRDNSTAMDRLSPLGLDPASFASQAMQIAERYLERAKARQLYATSTLSEASTLPEAKGEQIVQAACESIRSLHRGLQAAAPRDWHEAAIAYLDLDAAARDLARWLPQDLSTRQLRESLSEIERLLRFNSDDVDRADRRFQSPVRFDPEAFRSALLSALTDWARLNADGPQDQARREPIESTPSVANET